jgi:hypothetical protein
LISNKEYLVINSSYKGCISPSAHNITTNCCRPTNLLPISTQAQLRDPGAFKGSPISNSQKDLLANSPPGTSSILPSYFDFQLHSNLLLRICRHARHHDIHERYPHD